MKPNEKLIIASCSLLVARSDLLAQVHDAIIATDINGIICFWNASAERVYGYCADEVIGKSVGLLYFSEDVPLLHEAVLGPLRAKGLLEVRLRRRRKDNAEVFVSLRVSVIHDMSGIVIGYVGCSHDITERKKAEDELARTSADLERRVQERTRDLFELNFKLEEEAAERRRIAFELRESQERLQHLLLRSPGVLYSCEPSGNFPATFTSDNASSVFGYSAQQFVQEPSFWVDHIHPDDRARVLESAAKTLEAGFSCHEYRFQHGDGGYRFIRDSAVAVRDDAGAVVEIVGYCEDITAEKEAEQARKEQEQLRFLADTLLSTQESERRRISRELHDDLNQRLATLILGIGLLERDLPNAAHLIQSRLHELKEEAAKISDEVRRIALQLHSAGLEQFGLPAALEQECATLAVRSQITIGFESKSARKALPEDVSLSLYRVAQECLRNVVRHSQAQRAVVSLEDTADGIRLCVHDNGIGFEQNEVRARKSLGLISMNERVRQVNGTLILNSSKGGGTSVEVCVPIA